MICLHFWPLCGSVPNLMQHLANKPWVDKKVKSTSLQPPVGCLLYTSDAADDLIGVDIGGRRLIKKKNIRSCSSYALV